MPELSFDIFPDESDFGARVYFKIADGQFSKKDKVVIAEIRKFVNQEGFPQVAYSMSKVTDAQRERGKFNKQIQLGLDTLPQIIARLAEILEAKTGIVVSQAAPAAQRMAQENQDADVVQGLDEFGEFAPTLEQILAQTKK